MADLAIYDSKRVVLMLFGFLVDSGYGDGDFIKLVQTSDDFGMKTGTDGQTTRFKTNDFSATMTVILAQRSTANAKLAAIRTLGQFGTNGSDVGPFLIKDLEGTLIASGSCWIQKPPDIVFAREPTDREWTLGCVIDFRLDGG
jgi:Protein of unknown function (DUF3277)